MPRHVKLSAIVAVGIAIMLLVILPPATKPTEPPPATTVRGAFHVHSDRSDGSGTVDTIAA